MILYLIFFIILNFNLNATILFKADFSEGVKTKNYERIILRGSVEIKAPDYILRADKVEIYGYDSNYIKGEGNVYFDYKKKQIEGKADKLLFNRLLNNFILEENVELLDKENNILIKSQRLEGSENGSQYIIQYSLRIYKDDIFIKAENAIFNKDLDELILEGFPILYQENNFYSANRIILNTNNNEFKLEGNISGEFFEENK